MFQRTLLLVGVMFILAVAASRLLSDDKPATRPAAELELVNDTDSEPILTTEQFESGELDLKKVTGLRLETFLRDLHERRNTDRAESDGKDGPHTPYLSGWIDKVTSELLARGYGIDREKRLHRPGPIVPIP